MDIKEKCEKKLNADEGIIAIKKIIESQGFCDSFRLTGGAVVDILDGRTPKDYDIDTSHDSYSTITSKLKDVPNIRLLYTSSTAITLLADEKYKVQILKTDINSFNFEIEKSAFLLKSGKLTRFDYLGYKDKILVINNTFGKKIPKYRIKHWEKKGYTLPDISLKSHKSAIEKEKPTIIGRIKGAFKRVIKES